MKDQLLKEAWHALNFASQALSEAQLEAYQNGTTKNYIHPNCKRLDILAGKIHTFMCSSGIIPKP